MTNEAFIEGISEYQVFPSNDGAGSITLQAKGEGLLEISVTKTKDGSKVAQKKVEVNSSTTLQNVVVDNVPVGGEYTVQCKMGEQKVSFEHILVGEIWVVSGQSNALGGPGEAMEPIPQVHILRGEKWDEGRDPLFPWFNVISIAPWVQAARTYYEQTGVPVGLMGYCAPAREIDHFMDFFQKDLPQLQPIVEKYGKSASVYLWYQGEADCETNKRLVYKDKLRKMVEAMRRYSENPDMRVVIVQLSYLIHIMDEPTTKWGKMRDVQRQFCVEDGNAILAPALPYSHKDSIHLSAEGAREFGKRIGQALAESRAAGKVVWQGPSAVSARFADASRKRIRVEFDSVKELVASDKAIGKMQPVGDEKWEDKVVSRTLHEDWFVTDDTHRGEPEIQKAVIEKGVLKVDIEGGGMDAAKVEPEHGKSVSFELQNLGFLQPTKVSVDGLSLILELPEPAGKDAKVSYALFSNSRSTLMDEQGRPAAAFVELPVE